MPLWADARTLAAFRGIELVRGELAPVVAGQLRPDADTGDWLLRLGGEPRNRGRLEIRREPDAGARPRRAGVLVLCGEDGNDHYLWVDNEGRLRIAPSDPGTQVTPGGWSERRHEGDDLSCSCWRYPGPGMISQKPSQALLMDLAFIRGVAPKLLTDGSRS